MKNVFCVFLGLLTAPLLAACGGGSSDSGGTVPPPTLTAVTPAAGPAAGGTAVSVTGTNFTGAAQIQFDGVAAANIVVVDPTSLTCEAPAGVAGTSVDVSISTVGGTDTLSMAFAYHPLPTTTAISLTRVSTSGGQPVTITGTGYTANAAGANTVTIGGAAAGAVTTVDDTTITCTLPGGAAGSLDVSVTNANGTGTLAGGITYVTPVLYAAVQQSFGAGVPGTFYSIDPATAAATVLGTTGIELTGLAYDVPSGMLYGISGGVGSGQSLYIVNPADGATTLVGAITKPNAMGDLTFDGPTLIGNVYANGLYSLDETTAVATLIGPNGGLTGQGIAADRQNNVLLAFGNGASATLQSVDTATGALTPVADLSPDPGWSICALAWLDGVLYGVENVSRGASATNLVTINPSTGAITTVGPLPDRVDAIEGNIR